MPDKTLDTKGLACPLPILKTKKALSELPKGAKLEVLATDPGSLPDFTAFCESTGNVLLEHCRAASTASSSSIAPEKKMLDAKPSIVILGLVPGLSRGPTPQRAPALADRAVLAAQDTGRSIADWTVRSG